MLFNSFEFILFFLPVTLVVFFALGNNRKHRLAMFWLVMCSLFFYGWWNPSYLFLIVFSMLFNYTVGTFLGKNQFNSIRTLILWLGISVNLGFLGYFKYANFFVDQFAWATGSTFHLEKIILPLAISFFTFQQIAFLVDSYRHETREFNFLQYCLFVTFFPQLIAGPIVHHKEMMPQFASDNIYRPNFTCIAQGVLVFSIGLVKKVVFADSVAVYATPVFGAAEAGESLTFFAAWVGTLAYTLQLYFDFSGYSDMAIGLALMFGIRLPLNFDSPYKSKSIIEFWRRWHMTLSRFLRDYLYIALGGSRKGSVRRYLNLFITMLLGGIWHGAGWTFIIWGMLHGTYLIINHAWRKLRFDILKLPEKVGILETIFARTLTLLAVMVGWVYFRAESVDSANEVLFTMFGGNGISLPVGLQSMLGTTLSDFGFTFNSMFGELYFALRSSFGWIIVLSIIALFMPNSQQIMQTLSNKQFVLLRRQSVAFGSFIGLSLYFVFTKLSSDAEFLYFNF